MKALKISTALSLLLLTAAAPGAWSVGDPNIDSGVGSSASRGLFGYSNNDEPLYDNPPNSYGVYRDAYGGFRDRGMLPDNLTTRVPEPTWEEGRRMNPGPRPGGGAPGGMAGGLGGGLLGGGLLGGLGGGLLGGIGGGIGGFGAGFGGGFGMGAAGLPFGAAGAFPAQAVRTPFGFAGTPGTSFPNAALSQRAYLPAGNYGPFSSTSTRTVGADGSTVQANSFDTPYGPYSSRTTTTGPATSSMTNSDGTTTTAANPQYTYTQSQYNGAENSSTTVQAPINGGSSTSTADSGSTDNSSNTRATQPDNSTIQTYSTSNNTPFTPDTINSMAGFTDRGSTGSIGGGFAQPQSSGSQNSVYFTNSQATGMSGGFATPQSSGHPNAVFNANSLNSGGALGGSFSTPATSGSERSAYFSNPNNRFGAGGLGGGISAGSGNRAFWGSEKEGDKDDKKSDGSIGGRRTGGASLRMENGTGGTGGTMAMGANGRSSSFDRFSGPAPSVIIPGPNADNSDGTYGFFGGATAMNEATRAGLSSDLPFMGGGSRSPMSVYAQARAIRDRRAAQSGFSAGEGPIGNLTTDMEQKLAALKLTPRQALGRVIGSTRLENGDILTYGTKGTLRLAADNSGSITFNSGEIVTFTKVAPDLRSIALRSTLIF